MANRWHFYRRASPNITGPSGSGEEDLPYMGVEVILVIIHSDQINLYKFWLTYHKESSHEILVHLGQSLSH